MRLFVAVVLPADVMAAASRVIGELRKRCDESAPRARLTWAVPRRMHLTLQFIGEANPSRTQAIEQALEPPFDLPPFEMAFGGTGIFPDARRPRVIWAGLTAGAQPLRGLQQQVAARLARAGVAPEDRPFQPHLTLARVREAAGLRAPSVLEGLADAQLGRVRVVETVLFESRATAGGQEYVARQRTGLGRRQVGS
jgi:2'-5' RNA ligase